MEIKFFKRITIILFSTVFIIMCVCMANIYILPRLLIVKPEESTSHSSTYCSVSDNLERNYTKRPKEGCSVPIYEVTDERIYANKTDNCILCSRNLFKKYYALSTSFLSQGSWNLFRVDGKIRHAYFRTPFCSFSRLNFSYAYLDKCFASQRVRRILAMGDSNGRNTFDALKDIISSSLLNCRMVNKEHCNLLPNMSYYLGPGNYSNMSDIILRNRNCRTCSAVQHECYYGKGNKKQSLILEHLPMNFIVEGSIQIRKGMKDAQPANFTHEFILRDYLRNKMPNIIIISIPCAHEWRTVKRNSQIIKESLRHVIRDINKYIPKTTQIYWVPYQYVHLSVAIQTIPLCNKLIFESLREYFEDPKSNMHATLDTYQLSCPFKDLRNLPKDPYHMKPKWYELYVRQILQQICNEQ